MNILSRIATAVVLTSLLISAPTSAAPDGSLRKMLDTKITLIEYITLHTRLTSLERMLLGRVTKWGDYSSVVTLDVYFDFDEGELLFNLEPVDKHYFGTVAEAKSYCRDLIRADIGHVWIQLVNYSRANGWEPLGLNRVDFQDQLNESTKIRVFTYHDQILTGLPDQQTPLKCEASLDKGGYIANFSYNY